MKYSPSFKKGSKKSAVSDIIGNLLILAITVTLFSSVLYYVNNIPGPQNQTYADFSYEQPIFFGVEGVRSYALINVTMGGGQTMLAEDIVIVLIVNDVSARYTLQDGGVGPTWVTGEMWSGKLYDVLPDDDMEIMIIDTQNNNIVWQTNLVTGMANQNYAPIITERGIVQYPLYDGTSLTFYCRVVDFNSNLNINSVYVDLNGLGINEKHKMTYDPSSGTFRVTPGTEAALEWNGKTITFNATDLTNLETKVDYTVTVFKDEIGDGNNNPGGPPGNIDFSGLQGFNIFEYNDWIENGYEAKPERIFDRTASSAMSESVIIVVVSKYLVNTEVENNLQVLNTTTKLPYGTVSSPTVKFTPYQFVSGFYVYTAMFNTSKLPDKSSYYYVMVSLKDNWAPNHQFIINDMIFVKVPGGSQLPNYPVILTYKDSSYTQLSNDFTTYDPSNNIIYVEILNYNGNDWDPYTGDVEIRDFFWNAQLKKMPAIDSTNTPLSKWNGPISNLWQIKTSPAPPGVYRFAINLNNVTDGASWIPGKNAYALRYDMFKAGTEKSLMSKIVNITAPSVKLDIAVGSQPTGNARFATANALYYYANENLWYPPQLLETGSSDKQYYSPNVQLVRAGDMNGDNRSDLVAVLLDQKTNVIYLHVYYNAQSSLSGGWIKVTPSTLASMPIDLAIGNIDYDGDSDIVVAYSGKLDIYRNDGAWTRTTITLTNINKILMADMDPAGTAGNDPDRAQDIIVSRTGGLLTILKNRYGDGVAWDESTLTSTGTAPVDTWAEAEYNVTGTVVNNYLYTTSPNQDDGVYELIKENITWKHASLYPSEKGKWNTVTDPLSELAYADIPTPIPYTIGPGYVGHVVAWDSTDSFSSLVPVKVTLTVKYYTDPGYGTSGDYIIWRHSGTNTDTIQIEDTNGAWVVRNYDFDPTLFPEAYDISKMRAANMTLTNTKGAPINFDYWWINITWKTNDALEHIWKYTLNPASSGNHQLNVYALRNSTVDGDNNFLFSYATSLSGPWSGITMSPALIGTSLPMMLYTGSIPGTVSGAVYIKVKNVTTADRIDPSPDFIRIGQMKIITTVSTTAVGSSILAMNVADIDQDGDSDILVVGQKPGNTGQVFVLYNGPGDIFLVTNIKAASNADAQLYSAKSITAGKYFEPYNKPYLDIAVSTSGTKANPSSILFIKQTDKATRSYTMSSFKIVSPYGSIIKMIGVDVDGNNRGDLVLVTVDGYVVLYANYKGLESISGWQTYIVDKLEPGMVNDFDVSKFAP